MKNPWTRFEELVIRDLWSLDRSSLGMTGRFFLDTARFLVVIVRDVLYGQVTLWAMGLVYTTLMSLVPLLAVAFSVLKAFGVQNKLEPFLHELLLPLGPNGPVIAQRIVEFVNNMRVGVLGLVGLGLLMWTVMSLIQKIEQAFNTIWRVRGSRSMLHQFSEYLSVVLVGPVLVVSALALTASLMSTTVIQRLVRMEPFGTLIAAAGNLVPYVLVSASFTFLYLFLPNTRVRWVPAITGGIVGGFLWETVGWGFASFIVASTKYAFIYSSFAILILFMTWIYLSWLILLVGAEVSFYKQNPQLLSLGVGAEVPNARLLEQTALSIMVLVAKNFFTGAAPWSLDALVARLGLTIGKIEDMIAALKARGLLRETVDDPPGYLPGKDLDRITLEDVYEAVRPQGRLRPAGIPDIDPADRIAREVDEAIGSRLGARTLRDVVRENAEEDRRRAA